jgi:AcrR family transcriptional regulator
VRDRLANGGTEKLLDDIMPIVAAGGFSDVKISDLARRLHCSAATLYKIAPSKSELIVMVMQRWGVQVLERAEARSRRHSRPSARARAYYREGAESVGGLSHEFRADVQRFPAARQAYQVISDRFVDRFTDLLEEAADAGEARPVNAVFLARLLRYIAMAIRDEDLLLQAGLTAGEALLEVDTVIWDGVGRNQREA